MAVGAVAAAVVGSRRRGHRGQSGGWRDGGWREGHWWVVDRLLGQLKTAHASGGVAAALGGSGGGSWEELEAAEKEAVLEGFVKGEGGLLGWKIYW